MDARRLCTTCSSYLASDNPGPQCSPCWRSGLYKRASTAFRSIRDGVLVRKAFADGGVPAVAEALGCPLADALQVAWAHKLVPVKHRRRADTLVQLLELGPVSHVEAAEQLGLSRWTVGTYRRDLGVRPRPDGLEPPTQPREPTRPPSWSVS